MQQALAIAGLTFLTILMVNYYNTNSFQQSSAYYNEAVITATGAGQSLLEEIKTRAFDENTVAGSVSAASELTAYNSFGTETGETNINQYDDVDDFHNYSRVVSSSRLGDYTVKAKVNYIDPLSPGTVLYTQSYSKLVTVWVKNNYLTDSLTVNVIIGY